MYSCIIGTTIAYTLAGILDYDSGYRIRLFILIRVTILLSDWFITRNNLVNYPTSQLSTMFTPINKPISLQNNSGNSPANSQSDSLISVLARAYQYIYHLVICLYILAISFTITYAIGYI